MVCRWLLSWMVSLYCILMIVIQQVKCFSRHYIRQWNNAPVGPRSSILQDLSSFARHQRLLPTQEPFSGIKALRGKSLSRLSINFSIAGFAITVSIPFPFLNLPSRTLGGHCHPSLFDRIAWHTGWRTTRPRGSIHHAFPSARFLPL